MSAEFTAFNEKQNGIYGNFQANQAQIPNKGLEVDGGTAVQSGYLIAWRFPEAEASEIADHSQAMSEVVPSFVYGHNNQGLDNAHVTLSDYDVVKERVLNPDDEETALTLTSLNWAVRTAIGRTGLVLPHDALRFEEGVVHNGKTAIMPGQAYEALFDVRQSVIRTAGGVGTDLELKGAWGAHSTTSRVLAAKGPEDPAIEPFLAVVDQAPILGAVRPSSLDVGYFNASPELGFDFHPIYQYEVTSGKQL